MAWFGVGYLFISGYRLSRNMMNAFIRPLVKEAETGLAFGFLETVGSITQVIAPPVAGFLYTRDPLSIYSTSFFLIIIFLVVNLFLLPRFQSRKEPTIEPITYT
jgi:MFS family permease